MSYNTCLYLDHYIYIYIYVCQINTDVYIYIYRHYVLCNYIINIYIYGIYVSYISSCLGSFFSAKKGCLDQIKTLFVKSQQAGFFPLSVSASKAVEAGSKQRYHDWSPPNVPPRNKGLIASLIKGNHWLISPDHKVGYFLGP